MARRAKRGCEVSNLQAANDHIARIADVPECDLFAEERYLLALHDERNRLRADNAAHIQTSARLASEAACERLRAEKAEAELIALRAALDPERIIAAIELPGGHYSDPQAVADAIRAYCSAALVAHGTPNIRHEPRPTE